LIVFTCHILLAKKNRVFFKFSKRFCQVFTPNTKQVNCCGWCIECRICTDSCL